MLLPVRFMDLIPNLTFSFMSITIILYLLQFTLIFKFLVSSVQILIQLCIFDRGSAAKTVSFAYIRLPILIAHRFLYPTIVSIFSLFDIFANPHSESYKEQGTETVSLLNTSLNCKFF